MPLEPLGRLLERFGRLLEHLGHLLEPTWELLGVSWAQLGASRIQLGASWEPLGLHLALPTGLQAQLGLHWALAIRLQVPVGLHLALPTGVSAPPGFHRNGFHCHRSSFHLPFKCSSSVLQVCSSWNTPRAVIANPAPPVLPQGLLSATVEHCQRDSSSPDGDICNTSNTIMP